VEIALGDATLSEEEFEKLASLKVPLVNIRDSGLNLNLRRLRKPGLFEKSRGLGENEFS